MLRAALAFAASLALLCAVAWSGHAERSPQVPDREGGLLELDARRLNGAPEPLAHYRGQVLLVVNTASRCGYTPQYEGLQALYDRYRSRGFSVLGFPSNDFAGQEPGSESEIAQFCEMNYGVEFPMFAKVRVTGSDAHPVYRYLTSLPEPIGGPVQWNFQKYLVDRDGAVVDRYASKVRPEDPQLVARIEALLEAPRPE